MGIDAFTNRVGHFFRKEEVVSYQVGKYYGDENLHYVFDRKIVNYEESFKPSPIQGDRKTNYDYSRSVKKVLSDIPAVTRWWVVTGYPETGLTVNVDLKTQFFISGFHDIGSYQPPNTGADNAKDRAVVNALNNLRLASSDAGANLGEIKQTIGLLADSASKLLRAILALRRLDFRAFVQALGLDYNSISASQLRTISDWWLAYSYGWKPLLNDLFTLNEIVHQDLRKQLFVRGVATGKSVDSTSFNYYGQIHSATSKYKVRCTVFGEIERPELFRANESGLVNPLSIAWELVPWSFVIDWFIPIGATLAATTAGVGLIDRGGYYQEWWEYDVRIQMECLDPPWYNYFLYVEPGDYHEVGFTFNRIAFTNWPRPEVYANVQPYSTQRALNALALLRQIL